MVRFDKILFCVLVICVLSQCKTSQFEVGSSRNGNCYAKCLIIDKVVTEIEEYVVYTGNKDEEEVELIEKQIVIQPETTKWMKKKADRNCLSADPDDCLVWCLVRVDPIVRTVTVLADTTQSKNFKREIIEREVDRVIGRSFEWREVVCENDVTRTLIGKIQQSLSDNQYYDGPIHGNFDLATKKALKLFQGENKLPIGQLDFETLDVLGVVAEVY